MEEQDNKSIISSVLFLDIVEYSRKSVSEQIALKEGFNNFLSAAIRDVPLDDRIILDTGDGAAINFLGDAGDALRVALGMRESLLDVGAGMNPPLLVRMGINLGPVRLVKDINGLPNIVGDGINVAQRVMGFAAPGQILVSQSYFDAVSRLSQEYAGMFHYQGSRTDKHVREHEVYAIGYPGEFVITQKNMAVGDRAVTPLGRLLARFGKVGQIADDGIVFLNASYNQASAPLRAVIKLAALGMGLAVLVVLIWKMTPRPAPDQQIPDQQMTVEPGAVAAQSAVAQSAASARETGPSAGETSSGSETTKQAQLSQNKTRVKIARVRTLEETSAINTGAQAVVSLAVTPWGEIYLDGRMQGVSPPLAELQVVPGEHEIEIRNATFPVYKQKFQVQPNGKIKIKHKFGR